MDNWQHTGPPAALMRFYKKHSRQVLSSRGLRQQSRLYRGTGGSSEGNREAGFVPAFIDSRTGAVYRSTFADGRPAPLHLLDGLPEQLVVRRNRQGRVTAARGTLLAGFLRDGRFYTREEAARALVQAEPEQAPGPRTRCHRLAGRTAT